MHNRSLIAIGFVVTLAYSALVTTITLSQKRSISAMERQNTYNKVDQPFIDAAKRLWSERTREDMANINRTRFPVVMLIDKEVCVELRLFLGSIGGNPIYCFDESSRRLTRRIDVVD